MTSALGVTEVGLIRFGIGALLFLPVLFKQGFWPRGIPAWQAVSIPLFGGVLFLVLLGLGLKRAPVADSGVFTPSLLPFFVAALSALFLGERFSGQRLTGFGLILFGALAVGGIEAVRTSGEGVWVGHLLFVYASISWAIYTVIFRISGLGALHGGALFVFLGRLSLSGRRRRHRNDVRSGRARDTGNPDRVPGGVVGLCRDIGPSSMRSRLLARPGTAAFAALVPVLAALGGWVFLDEPIGALKAIGIVVVSVGVLLASGALGKRV